jgi:hypothetical protein
VRGPGEQILLAGKWAIKENANNLKTFGNYSRANLINGLSFPQDMTGTHPTRAGNDLG